MAYNLKGRNFLTLKDYTPDEIDYLLKLAAELKRQKYAGIRPRNLEGKSVALILKNLQLELDVLLL